MPTRDPATKGVACSRSAYAGSSGITIPKPIRSMKTVRKRTTSGERWKPGGDTARGNRKGSPQSSEAARRRSTLPTFQQRGDTDELGEVPGLHLGHDLTAVNLDGLLGDSELARDRPVRPPRHDELHDLALPRGEPREALAELLALRRGAAHLAVHLESVGDAVEQALAAEGFLEEVDGARLHRPHRRRYIAVSRDHDDREADVAAGERALEIEPAHPGQADVGHDAAGTPAVLGLQELLRPGIRFDGDVDGRAQVAQALAYPRIVLDDVDLRVGHHGSSLPPCRAAAGWTLPQGLPRALGPGLIVATDVHPDTPIPEPGKLLPHPGDVGGGRVGRHPEVEPCATPGPQRVFGDRLGDVRREQVRAMQYGARLAAGRHDAGPDPRWRLLASRFGRATCNRRRDGGRYDTPDSPGRVGPGAVSAPDHRLSQSTGHTVPQPATSPIEIPAMIDTAKGSSTVIVFPPTRMSPHLCSAFSLPGDTARSLPTRSSRLMRHIAPSGGATPCNPVQPVARDPEESCSARAQSP